MMDGRIPLIKGKSTTALDVSPNGRGFAASRIYQTGDGRFKRTVLLLIEVAALPFDPVVLRDVDVVWPL
jgi:hypothetical protein